MLVGFSRRRSVGQLSCFVSVTGLILMHILLLVQDDLCAGVRDPVHARLPGGPALCEAGEPVSVVVHSWCCLLRCRALLLSAACCAWVLG